MKSQGKIRFDVLTIFPEMFGGYFNSSMMKKAQEKGLVDINVWNLRDYAKGKHKVTDDVAYGGISGMVMKVEPVYYAVEDVKEKFKKENKFSSFLGKKKSRVVLLSAKGKTLNQKEIRRLSEYSQIILIAGHYKGVDERVAEYIADEEISIGDYVITGGELPAMVVVDAISRMVPGVIGRESSKEGESFSVEVEHEHGVYTRPEVFSPKKGEEWKVPEVLVSGNHKKIEEWRKKNRKESDD